MAHASVVPSLSQTNIQMLGSEILLIIFEKLSDSSPEFLQGLRPVSHTFNCFVTAIRYRTIPILQKLLDHNTNGVNTA
ncbi:hypothetical protein ONS96_006781 [Cadophora gregata f. sp. sojae]|nr:hypothetical protein ONS96_006781 [Cadophora gregata f. sp. sojae]